MASDEALGQEVKSDTVDTPKTINLLIVNMDKVLFEGMVDSIIAPGPSINIAILPGHTPLYTKLSAGAVVINSTKGTQEVQIEDGIAKITQDKVVILVGFKSNEALKKAD